MASERLNLQQLVEIYAAVQKDAKETSSILSANTLALHLQEMELDLKKMGLKVRMTEAKNNSLYSHWYLV